MSVALIKQMQSTLAGLVQQVTAYQSAIDIAEKEAQIQQDGTFKGAFAARVKRGVRKMKASGGAKVKTTASGKVKPGVVRDFLNAHANLTTRPTEEARRLLPLAHKAGIPTTLGSLVVALGKIRAHTNGAAADHDQYSAPLLAHLKGYGPMPFPSVRDWFAEAYPEAAEANPRTAVTVLTGLKGAGKASLTPDGWWQAI